MGCSGSRNKALLSLGHTGYSRFRSYTLWERTLLEQVVFLLFYISLLATGMVLITKNKVIRTIAQIVLGPTHPIREPVRSLFLNRLK